jgi:hypothetical protein
MKISILGERISALTAVIDKVEKKTAELFCKLPHKSEDFPVGDIPSLAALISEIEDTNRFLLSSNSCLTLAGGLKVSKPIAISWSIPK